MERIIIAASAIAVAGLVLTALSATALGSAKAAAKWPSAERPRMGAAPARIGVVLGVLLCAAAAGVGVSLVPVTKLWVLVPLIVAAGLITLGLTAWAAVKLASKIELSALINAPSPLGGEVQTATRSARTQPPTIQGPPTQVSPEQISYGKPYPGMVTVASPPGSPPALDLSAADGVHTTTPDSSPPATQSPVSAPAVDPADVTIPPEALPGWVYTDEADNWYLVTSVPDGHRLLRLSDFSVVSPGAAAGALSLAGSIEMTVWPANPDDTDTQEHPVVVEEEPPPAN